MKIIVSVKQVPDTSGKVAVNPDGTLNRASMQTIINPDDMNAVEAALKIKDATGCKVLVVTMGPPPAEGMLRELIAMGADEGYVFSDRRLGGADVLATSYTLSQAIRSVGDFDLILCGRQTTDGDTAQVGPAIAEHLGIPHAAWVGRLEAAGDGVDAEQHLQDVIETVHMPFPCLVTVEQDICMPRLPSLKTARETAQRVVHIQGLDSFLDTDPDHYGLTGSPTQVERIFPPQSEVEHEIWEDAQAPKRLYTQLKKWKFI